MIPRTKTLSCYTILLCLLLAFQRIRGFRPHHPHPFHRERHRVHQQQPSKKIPNLNEEDSTHSNCERRQFFQQAAGKAAAISSLMATTATLFLPTPKAHAAPPISIIAEELGYFPVQNKDGTVMYVPKRVQRQSTPQAIELAKLLKSKGVTMYGAYWCPHCSRQKELFGAQAWSQMNYVECSPKGYGFAGMCKDVDGYPTFRNDNNNKGKSGKNGEIVNVSGERSLEYLAQQVGFTTFDPTLEDEVPMVGTTCKLPKP